MHPSRLDTRSTPIGVFLSIGLLEDTTRSDTQQCDRHAERASERSATADSGRWSSALGRRRGERPALPITAPRGVVWGLAALPRAHHHMRPLCERRDEHGRPLDKLENDSYTCAQEAQNAPAHGRAPEGCPRGGNLVHRSRYRPRLEGRGPKNTGVV